MTDEMYVSDNEDMLYEYYAYYADLNFPEASAANGIYLYVSPVLLLIGTVGNIISALVMYRLSYTVLSTCQYLMCYPP